MFVAQWAPLPVAVRMQAPLQPGRSGLPAAGHAAQTPWPLWPAGR